MDALSDLGLSEVAPQQGRPHVLWIVCRSSSKACLTLTALLLKLWLAGGGMWSNVGIVF
jgi:hypothetical protein